MIKREHIQKNKEILFVFGDNNERRGLGGMAKEFRGEPNSMGIRTKKSPSRSSDSYYCDSNYASNCRRIKKDIKAIEKAAKDYQAIYIPDGIGAGLAKLPDKAPKTYKYLIKQLEKLRGIYK